MKCRERRKRETSRLANARSRLNGMLDGKLQCGDGDKYRLRRVMRSEESSGSQAKLGV